MLLCSACVKVAVCSRSSMLYSVKRIIQQSTNNHNNTIHSNKRYMAYLVRYWGPPQRRPAQGAENMPIMCRYIIYMCMCVCVYAYIYIYICIHTCVYIYIYIYTHIHTCTCMYMFNRRPAQGAEKEGRGGQRTAGLLSS